MTEKLKPCPFCGGEATSWWWLEGRELQYMIGCKRCMFHRHFISICGTIIEQEEQAIAAWNKRCEDGK